MENQVFESIEAALAGRNHGPWKSGRELFPSALATSPPCGQYLDADEEELFETISYTGPALTDEDQEEIDERLRSEGFSFYTEEQFSQAIVELTWTKPTPEYDGPDDDQDY